MQGWWNNFIIDHGVRLFYMSVATIFATIFIFSGIKELVGAGVTILIQVVTLAINKCRSAPKPKEAVMDPTPE